jgi:hypothetical protein
MSQKDNYASHPTMEKNMAIRLLGLALILLGVFPLTGMTQEITRTAGNKPDMQGIWQAQTRAAFNLEDHVARVDMQAGQSVVAGGNIPYQDWAMARRQENFANRSELDPLSKCYLPGVPRIMAMPWPFQIFQTDEHVAITFEWTQVYRLIYTAGQEPLYPGFEHWMGDSRGHWEGDTLVVEIRDLNDRTWMDAAGNFHSAAAVITERYTLQDANTIQYQATIDDPEVFTEPWTISYPLKRQTEMTRLLEYQCQAEVEEANGVFEPEEEFWYPAPIPETNTPFDITARSELPLPTVPADIQRQADGSPDISGTFSADARGRGANYGLEARESIDLFPAALGVVVDPLDGVLPYQDWARQEMQERREPWRGYDDPTAHCFVASIPRSHYVPAPFFILQPPGYVVFLYERMSYRVIPLDERDFLPDTMRLWMGDAVGHWDDDTLIVESANYNGKAWLNEFGDVISHAQEVVETYTPVSNEQMIYRATVSDPITYSRPWTIELSFSQQAGELLEVACLEDNNDLGHLRDVRDEYRSSLNLENPNAN